MLSIARADLYSAEKKSSLKLATVRKEINLSALEKDLSRLARESGYQNLSTIYKNIYAQSDRPQDIKNVIRI